MFQYEELVHYSGSEGMSVGGYGDDVRGLPPPQYGHTIPDSLKHHKDQIYGYGDLCGMSVVEKLFILQAHL